jgi:hypothetical protein
MNDGSQKNLRRRLLKLLDMGYGHYRYMLS